MAALTKDMSLGGLFAVAVVCVAVFWILGAVAHALLRDRGFGVIGNAAMMAFGGGLGVYAKILILGPLVI